LAFGLRSLSLMCSVQGKLKRPDTKDQRPKAKAPNDNSKMSNDI
jgi:hypothetical protein